jgi:hypothetical protein
MLLREEVRSSFVDAINRSMEAAAPRRGHFARAASDPRA